MQTLALAEFFAVARDDADEAADELVFEGELSRFDRIGWQLTGGRSSSRVRPATTSAPA